MLAVLVGVAFNHGERLVTGNPLHGRQVHPGLYKMGNGRMAQGMPDNLLRVQPGCDDNAAEGLKDIDRVAVLGSDGREKPGRPFRKDIYITFQKFGKVVRDRLLAHSGFRFRDENNVAVEVYVLAADAEDFHFTHGGFKADDDEGVYVLVLVLLGAFNQSLYLLNGRYVIRPCPS